MSASAAAIVPSRQRRAVAALAVVSALVVAGLGLVLRGSAGPDGADRRAAAAVQALGRPGTVAYAVDGLVTVLPLLLTLAVLAVAGLLLGRRRLAALALLGPLCVAGATTVLKPVVGRTIHGDNLSFPSGHTGCAAAVGLVVGLLLLARLGPASRGLAGLLLLGPAVVTGVGMAVDQVVLDAHYASDTIGGFAVALAVVLGLALLLDQVLDRRGGVATIRDHRRGRTCS